MFANRQARAELEAIVHPHVYRRINEWFADLPAGTRIAIADIPLLFETGHQHDFERVIVCGITTNCCVESTVRDASHREYQTWLVTDAVAESSRDRHDYAIQCMTMLFARGTTVAEVCAASA